MVLSLALVRNLLLLARRSGLDELQTSKLLIGNSGVYKLKLPKTIAEDLPDYSSLALKLENEERKNLPSLIISALKMLLKSKTIEHFLLIYKL